MNRRDLNIIVGIALVGLIAAFWFLVLSPKREEASELGTKVSELEASVAAQEDLAANAEEAEQSYGQNYHQVVVLGKAVPEDADTSSLLVALQRTADHDDIDFNSITLGQGGADEAAAASQVATPPPLTAPGESSGSESSTESAPAEGAAAPAESGTAPAAGESAGAAPASSSTTPAATPPAATATETAAATLPLGAAVGPAGLPIMPYDLAFTGGFFEIADFFASVDALVHTAGEDVGVRGRLLTVNGFSLTPVDDTGGGSDPPLNADVSVTSYVTPAEQGIVAGSTPVAPAPTTPPASATPTSSTTTTTPAPAP